MSTLTPHIVQSHVPALHRIAREAGKAILAIYHGNEEITANIKKDDSPVTAADLAAHRIIEDGLTALWPDIPVLSEEAAEDSDWSRRRKWSQYWLVDPLDGTKEFLGRTGEFTVNMALISDHEVIAGIVYLPEGDTLYWAIKGVGAWKSANGCETALHSERTSTDKGLRVVASRRHGSDQLAPILDKMSQRFGKEKVALVTMGSSLKICALAEGKADWYPRLAPTSEWDTAAAQVVLEEAGGQIVDTGFEPLRYNTKESLLNPSFHAFADPAFPWKSILLDG